MKESAFHVSFVLSTGFKLLNSKIKVIISLLMEEMAINCTVVQLHQKRLTLLPCELFLRYTIGDCYRSDVIQTYIIQ